MLTTGNLIGMDNRKYISEYGRLMSDAEIFSDMVYEQYIKPYWNGRRIKFFDTYTDFKGGADYPLHPDNLQEQLSKSPMFVSMFTHGRYNDWGLEDWLSFEYDENGDFIRDKHNRIIEHHAFSYMYNNGHASELVAPNYTLITTIACDTNMFDEEASGILSEWHDPCFSEVLIRNKNNGIIGYLGCSRSGYVYRDIHSLGGSARYEGIFYKTLFNSEIKDKNFGKIVALSKTSMGITGYKTIMFPLNPVGDSEMPIYTEIPHEFEEICIFNKVESGSDKQKVIILSGTPDAVIAISDNNNLALNPIVYQGVAEVELPDNASICITKQNYVPLVYHTITTGDTIDFYQEIPMKDGFEEKHVAQLYPNMYDPQNYTLLHNFSYFEKCLL